VLNLSASQTIVDVMI